MPVKWRSALKGERPNWDLLFSLALKWPTCACGNQDERIARYADGAPEDTELRALGSWFMRNVSERNSDAALETLDKIEARAAKLLAEL